ncbi:MAG: prephenate dehydrogenase [Clostridia bacterium]|nr:prephenate dehydrogenase [Clostridia bacterium]
MTVGIVGLGLIGGSFAKAYDAAGHCVLAYDTNASVLSFSQLSGEVAGELTDERIGECDLILLCVYPRAAVEWVKKKAPLLGKNQLVMDCCGTKRTVCNTCFAIAEQYGFVFVGGHPMAGTHHSGYKYATEDLYRGAPMVIVPPDFDHIDLLDRVKRLLQPVGFGQFSVTTAEQHDQMIAFTSQLAHVVSNAYIKSPTALKHQGFSAGSYKDMTRVARLNPEMWAELFLENKEYLVQEINQLLDFLSEYKEALQTDNQEELIRLLAEGSQRKAEVDGL